MNHHQLQFGHYYKPWQSVRTDKMNPVAVFMLTIGLIRLVAEDEP